MPPALSPVLVRKICSPHNTGEEWPVPGNSIFQLMSALVILVGMVLQSLTPAPFGPRKRVHSCAAPSTTEAARLSAAQWVMRKRVVCVGLGILNGEIRRWE